MKKKDRAGNLTSDEHIKKDSSNYDTLTSRNYHFIPPEIQNTIKNTTLCFLGCGLGANIALLAARSGFRKFLLYDFDTIELHNLNRQPFFRDDIATDKVKTLEKYLHDINPDVKISHENRKVDLAYVKERADDFDFCINTIDYGKDFVEITDYIAFKKKKPVLLPMNIGFGSFIMVFDHNSCSFKSLIGDSDYHMINITNRMIEKSGINLPDYISPELIFDEIMKKQYYPQLGLAATLCGSLVNSIIIKMLRKEDVRLAPEAIYVDINNHLSP